MLPRLYVVLQSSGRLGNQIVLGNFWDLIHQVGHQLHVGDSLLLTNCVVQPGVRSSEVVDPRLGSTICWPFW